MNERDAAQPLIEQVCVRPDHFAVGRERPDGTGHLTLVGRQWAYCSAALAAEQHTWYSTGGIALTELRHDIDWLAKPATSIERGMLRPPD